MHAVVPAFPLLVAFKLLFTWHNHNITSICSASFCQGKLPTDCMENGFVVSVYKKGSHSCKC